MSTSFEQMWSELTPIGRADSGGYRRYAWTREDHILREWFAGEAARRGLDLVEDRAGNQWAWWGDPTAGNALAIGSHLDSVPDGGAFDGPLGVVSSLAVIDRLQAAGVRPSRPLVVINFVDEEGARFGIACAGSRIITGQLDADRARSLTDADGISMAEAWRSAGRDPEDLGTDPEMLGLLGQFVELHVEQGKALVDTDDPIGIGSDIWPHGRWRLDFAGVANHAGTTALADRHDAMLGYARTVLDARRLAADHGVVATMGKVRVEPNGVNAIPSAVTGWLDVRGADEAAVIACVEAIATAAADCDATISRESWTATTGFDPALTQQLSDLLTAPVLGTGAGHDAGVLAAHGVPTSMIFVRNPTGVSHSPAEYAELDDCLAGVDALQTVVEELTR